MKRQGTVLAAIVCFLCALGLLGLSKPGTEEAGAFGAAMLQKGGLAVETEVLPETPAPSPSEPAEPTETPAPRPVPVETVEEAWDEEARKTEPETEPKEIFVTETEAIELRNETDYGVDFSQLPALEPLPDVGDAPAILIMHTHGSESYAESVENPGTVFRTQDESKSVIAVGEVLAEGLRQAGFSVIHDRTICDEPDFNHAYSVSRQVIQKNLEENPSIFLVLDVHRDAVENPDGSQMRMVTEAGDCARLMLVVGSDAGGLEHPNWQENLTLGAILQTRLEGACPGLMRPMNLRTERFNQDLGRLSFLVEVGASGNTLEEAKTAAARLGEQLGALLRESSGKSS